MPHEISFYNRNRKKITKTVEKLDERSVMLFMALCQSPPEKVRIDLEAEKKAIDKLLEADSKKDYLTPVIERVIESGSAHDRESALQFIRSAIQVTPSLHDWVKEMGALDMCESIEVFIGQFMVAYNKEIQEYY